MKDVLHKRIAAYIHRNAKVRGDLATGGLSTIIIKTPPSRYKNGFFKLMPHERHLHTWLFGTDNAVCTQCGLTVPKNEVDSAM